MAAVQAISGNIVGQHVAKVTIATLSGIAAVQAKQPCRGLVRSLCGTNNKGDRCWPVQHVSPLNATASSSNAVRADAQQAKVTLKP